MASDNSTVIGIVVLARHGDREGFYQDPTSYTASSTLITPLGETQEYQLGGLLRSLYLNTSSSSYIQGISPLTSKFDPTQVVVRADAGDEGGVIMDSAIALVQGLWPATPLDVTDLANGTNITSPLNGYQYVPIESVQPNEDVSLEGFADCPNFDTHNTDFYNSPEFLLVANQSAPFLDQLPPYLDGRPVSLENMWNIFDFMNVQHIHNATFRASLPPSFLPQARTLAGFHEYGVFSDSSPNGIGNIAIRTMLPSMLTAFQRFTNSSDGLKLHYSAIAYKPFLSLFNITGVSADGALPAEIVDYAASVVLELRQSGDSEPVVRFNFKNGTVDDAFHTYPMSFPGWDGSSGADVPLSTFTAAFEPIAVNSTIDWCNVCGQATERGCGQLLSAASTSGGGSQPKISRVGAGFLGAGLAIAVMLIALGVLSFLGFLTFGRKRVRNPIAEKEANL